jgi:tRNA(Leu) C34 or U34 (ribose-2'-O)-methylase TrmL
VSVTLVGDSIENPANALTMLHASQMFGAACRFRDTKGLAATCSDQGFLTASSSDVQALHTRIVACDNLPGAKDVFGFEAGHDFALLVGNERRGLSHEFAAMATDRVQVPMHSHRVNCLNVAAASAVGLYYLCGQRAGAMAVRKDPASRRPDVLLYQPADHFELGSTIRSAAAFGWNRALVEDRYRVWFGCARSVRAEGRAAARRGKNEIALIPFQLSGQSAHRRVTVITCQRIGVPIHRVNFAGGPGQLVVIPDESCGASVPKDWNRPGVDVEFASLQLPAVEFTYHYRLVASIALAEISRQVGRRSGFKPLPGRRPPVYDHELEPLAEVPGEVIAFEDLLAY